MSIAIVKKSIIALGIILFLLGLFMSVSHINYGFEVFVAGIVLLPTGFLIPIQENRKELYKENTQRAYSYPSLMQSIGITGMVLLGMVLMSPLKKILDDLVSQEFSSLIGYILSVGIVFTIAYNIRKSKNKVSSFNLSIGNKKIIPFIIVASIPLFAGIAGPLCSLIPMPESIKDSILQLAEQKGIWTFILMVLAAPFLEELIFRGIILDGLLKRYSPLTSIIISSALFGIAHFNPWQFVTGLLIGAFSGWVYYKTRSLTPSIIIHAAANFFGFLTRNFMDVESHMNKSMAESIGGYTNMVLLIMSSLILIFICIYYLQREFGKETLKRSA